MYFMSFTMTKNICTENDEILCTMCNFYENLYTSQSVPNGNIDLYFLTFKYR